MKSVKETEYFADLAGFKIDITVTEPAGAAKDTALFLHGAGQGRKEGWLPLNRLLSGHGWRCVAYSAPGHGNSSGTLLGSSLRERLEVARAVAEKCQIPPGSLLVGMSMGGHTAISLTGLMPETFSRLVLMVPAIYSQAAEDVPFGPEFSKIIRQSGSYHDSLCWQTLDEFSGRLAVVRTGQDDVIPADVYKFIRQHSHAAASRQFVLISDSPHRVNAWLQEHPSQQAAMAKALDSFDFSAFG